MSTITITITAQPSDFDTFANELGYQDLISKTPEEIALLVEPISIQDRLKANPQTRMQFVEDYLKNVTIQELYRKKAAVIDGQINATKEAEKVALKAGITSAVGVASQV